MKLETFFEKFDRFAEAPDAVAKMRELVLQLAVQGKLVEQKSAEGDADALLKAIAAARKMNGRGKSSEETETEELAEVDGWHQVPASWRWVRLRTIGDIVGGGTPRSDNSAYFADEGIPWLTPADLNGYKEKRILRGRRCITKAGLEESSARLLPAGSVLFSSRAPIGYVAIAGTELATNQGFKSCVPFISETNEFLYYYLKSAAARIDREASGTTFREVSGKIVSQVPVPLPPLAEQKRIVAKVAELMAWCDRLEAQQQERETRHTALARASLARFADAPIPANLPFLFHPSYAIPPADLRKSILTLAVQGKLVPQDPNDEPAEQLLARLDQERTRIAKEKGVRPPKNLPPLTAPNFPHGVPKSWRWSRIGHLALVIDYGTSQKADNDSSKVPVYRMGNIVGGRLIDKNMKYVDASIDDLPGRFLKTDDILFNRTNSYELVGKVGIFSGPDDTATFASYLIRVRLPKTLLFPPFYSVAMNAPYYRQTQIEPEIVQQCGQANFNGTKLAATIVPVPPLAEQKRIVAKVEQLMTLVDALETQLASSCATAESLLSALVAELRTQE